MRGLVPLFSFALTSALRATYLVGVPIRARNRPFSFCLVPPLASSAAFIGLSLRGALLALYLIGPRVARLPFAWGLLPGSASQSEA